ncbi:MAG: phosphotransferase [Legionellaceae bacterium]|nr:phosphotransferase [Legionellaceae bacterium]
MLTRQNTLHTWLDTVIGNSPFNLTPLAGDASFRRYFRMHQDATTYVVMDAPPGKEGLLAFVQIARSLADAGVRTPEIIAFDLDQGFALLEDLGDALLFNRVLNASPEQAEHDYALALDSLHKIQTCRTHSPTLGEFDIPAMERELQLFRTWFLERWLGITLTNIEENLLNHALSVITDNIIHQPQCFMHGDYHSRNLMLLPSEANTAHKYSISVLDFQDAVRGPFTYDLASLLKDAYIEWPEATRVQWVNAFYDKLPNTHGWSRAEFLQGFEMCGLQRHLKILGIFCRLDQRDGKSSYLRDLPLTLNYALKCIKQHKALRPFYDFMQTRVCPVFEEKINA